MLSWVINMRWNSLFQFDFLMAWSICSWIAIMHGPRLIGWYCKLCMWKLKLLGLSWVIYIEARFAPLDCIHVWTMHAVFVQKEEGWTSYYLNFLFVGVMYYKYKQLLFIWGFFVLVWTEWQKVLSSFTVFFSWIWKNSFSTRSSFLHTLLLFFRFNVFLGVYNGGPGDFWCLPPVWNVRAVSLIPLFYISSCSSA